jgi:CheY-like chemotaxis protein
MFVRQFVSDASPQPPPRLAAGFTSEQPRKDLPSILVVDDETIIADTLTQILNRNGFRAHACYGGREAIDTARRLQPSVVLSDIAMPQIDGIAAAVAIREFCPAARIVLFSGQSATLEILDRIRSLGHEFELLPKPIHPTELLRRLRQN